LSATSLVSSPFFSASSALRRYSSAFDSIGRQSAYGRGGSRLKRGRPQFQAGSRDQAQKKGRVSQQGQRPFLSATREGLPRRRVHCVAAARIRGMPSSGFSRPISARMAGASVVSPRAYSGFSTGRPRTTKHLSS
jgi:hypothetical protein